MTSTTTNTHTDPGRHRNAPGVNARLSQCVDGLTHAAEEARAADLFAVATTLFGYRDGVAALALDLWKREGGE